MKFDIVYADPPWDFKTYSDLGKGRSPDNHYPIMDLEAIKALKVDDITHKDAALFLWATGSMLLYAIETMAAWKFTYKSIAFVWIKTNKVSTDTLFTGMGYYTRQNAEYCLLGTKGNPFTRLDKGVHQVVIEPVAEHSKKPSCVRDRIINLFGDRPRIELFARTSTPGWTALGDEITGNDIRQDLKNIRSK